MEKQIFKEPSSPEPGQKSQLSTLDNLQLKLKTLSFESRDKESQFLAYQQQLIQQRESQDQESKLSRSQKDLLLKFLINQNQQIDLQIGKIEQENQNIQLQIAKQNIMQLSKNYFFQQSISELESKIKGIYQQIYEKEQQIQEIENKKQREIENQIDKDALIVYYELIPPNDQSIKNHREIENYMQLLKKLSNEFYTSIESIKSIQEANQKLRQQITFLQTMVSMPHQKRNIKQIIIQNEDFIYSDDEKNYYKKFQPLSDKKCVKELPPKKVNKQEMSINSLSTVNRLKPEKIIKLEQDIERCKKLAQMQAYKVRQLLQSIQRLNNFINNLQVLNESLIAQNQYYQKQFSKSQSLYTSLRRYFRHYQMLLQNQRVTDQYKFNLKKSSNLQAENIIGLTQSSDIQFSEIDEFVQEKHNILNYATLPTKHINTDGFYKIKFIKYDKFSDQINQGNLEVEGSDDDEKVDPLFTSQHCRIYLKNLQQQLTNHQQKQESKKCHLSPLNNHHSSDGQMNQGSSNHQFFGAKMKRSQSNPLDYCHAAWRQIYSAIKRKNTRLSAYLTRFGIKRKMIDENILFQNRQVCQSSHLYLQIPQQQSQLLIQSSELLHPQHFRPLNSQPQQRESKYANSHQGHGPQYYI